VDPAAAPRPANDAQQQSTALPCSVFLQRFSILARHPRGSVGFIVDQSHNA